MTNNTTDPPSPSLESVLSVVDEAIWSTAPDGAVVLWSPAAERLSGYSAQEMIGRTTACLLPPERQAERMSLLQRLAAGSPVSSFETVRLTKSGKRVDVSLKATPIRDAAGNVSGAVWAAREIARNTPVDAYRSLILETANQVALDILAERTGVEALRHIAEAARELSGAEYAALGVARPSGKGLVEFVTTGLPPEAEAAIGPRPHGAGVLGLLLERTEPLRIDNLSDHPASVGFPPNHPVMTSFLGVPIRRGETVLGSLYLTNKRGGRTFTEADVAAVQALGAHAAVAIHNLQMLSQQRALVRGLITAQEEERRAVAYDLHDGLTQYVMASHAHLEAFRRAHEGGKEERAVRELDRGLRYLKEAVVESRRLVNGLRTLALDDLGLAGALEQLLNEEKARAGWADADLIHNISGRRFDKSFETAVYRVAQEALTNARKHAQTGRVRVVMLTQPDGPAERERLRLEVRDWGHGFDREAQSEEFGGVGLRSMVERIRLLDGQFEIESAPGAGTTVRATVPVLDPTPEVEEETE